MITPKERIEVMQMTADDMIEVIKNDESFRSFMKTESFRELYDRLHSMFFLNNDRCIYNDYVSFSAFHRRYGDYIKAKIKYYQNKLLGVKTQYPKDYCIGVVLGMEDNKVELAPDPERLTYNSAVRRVHKLMSQSDEPFWLMRWNIYKIEDDGSLTVVDK